MTKINVWKCDICKKEFRDGNTTVPLEINIPNGSGMEIPSNFVFEDTCRDCRGDLSLAIEKLIK